MFASAPLLFIALLPLLSFTSLASCAGESDPGDDPPLESPSPTGSTAPSTSSTLSPPLMPSQTAPGPTTEPAGTAPGPSVVNPNPSATPTPGGGTGGAGGAANPSPGPSAPTGGTSPAPTEIPDITFADVATVLNGTCAQSVCHIPEEYGGLHPNLTNLEDELYDSLLNTRVEACGGDPLVNPGNPQNSALLKLPQHLCTDFVMPDGCLDNPCIDPFIIAALSKWIANGAQK